MVKFFIEQKALLPEYVSPAIINRDAVRRQGDLLRIDEVAKNGLRVAIERRKKQKEREESCKHYW